MLHKFSSDQIWMFYFNYSLNDNPTFCHQIIHPKVYKGYVGCNHEVTLIPFWISHQICIFKYFYLTNSYWVFAITKLTKWTYIVFIDPWSDLDSVITYIAIIQLIQLSIKLLLLYFKFLVYNGKYQPCFHYSNHLHIMEYH